MFNDIFKKLIADISNIIYGWSDQSTVGWCVLDLIFQLLAF